MKKFLCIIFILTIFQVKLKIPDEERKKLFDKYAKKIYAENFEENGSNSDSNLNSDLNGIKYNKAYIDELIKKYNLPSSYNFIKATGAPVYVKNQQKCGCCWAMAATTVLSYRFFKKGIDVQLSTQHELSCYFRDCLRGNKLIDPFLSLIINGTLTEECFPFTAGNQQIEECPSECKNPDIPYKKYYAKNAYTIEMDEDNIYDVTAIIMDQLITNGPVMTSIETYSDLERFVFGDNCTNEVYSYDGKSSPQGGHALTIVGYGLLDEKYYWLLQNTWGEQSCGDGFLKIEFGQVGVGSVSFAEPLVKQEDSGKVIEVSYVNMDDSCNIEIKTDSNLNNWKSQLVIVYEHNETKKEFDYICGLTEIVTDPKKTITCNYQFWNIQLDKGLYKYKTFRVTGKKNNFVFDDSFINKQFYFNGNDRIHPFSLIFLRNANIYHYISENSRRFYFLYEPTGPDLNLPLIYPSSYHLNTPLKHCQTTDLKKEDKYIAYCDISDEEFEYFDKCDTKGGNKLVTQSFCDIDFLRDIITCRMDENIYPIFRVYGFEILGRSFYSISIILNSDIEGNVTNYQGENNAFVVVVFIEKENQNNTYTMSCYTGSPQSLQKNYSLECAIYISEKEQIDNIYLFPYNGIVFLENPFEVIINETIKGINKTSTNSENSNNSYLNSYSK